MQLLNLSHNMLLLIVLPIVGGLFLLCTIVGGIFTLRKRAKREEPEPQPEKRQAAFTMLGPNGKELYEDIVKATEEFDSKYCIGQGGYGVVYRTVMTTGQVVAVKKFHSSQVDTMSNLKAFESEVQALNNIQHRNIVRLLCFCSHSKHSFLVYELIENGSLGMILSNAERSAELDWIRRINVVNGVASALSYMHHDCSPPIIHRDISSSNVLLDLEYEAHVSDFGTARLLMPDASNWTSLAGTLGYIAPGLRLDPNQQHQLLWDGSNEGFSVKSCKRALEAFWQSDDLRMLPNFWKWRVSSKKQIFIWIACHERLTSKLFLAQRGIIQREDWWCHYCRTHIEESNHILIHCNLAWRVWSLAFSRWGVSGVLAGNVNDLIFNKNCSFRSLWNILLFEIVWD